MFQYTFRNGDVITSNLKQDELMKRMRRLDLLRVLTEGYEEGEGHKIALKAWRAYHRKDNWTGIVRLTPGEKEFLSYKLEDDTMLDDEDRECLEYYIYR